MTSPDPATDAPQTPPAPEAQAPAAQPQQNLDELPSWARDAITTANREAAAHRVKVKELEPLALKAQELEQASKSETQKLTERLTAAESRALDAARFEVALDKGLTRSQARRLVGSTPEELAADADELLADLGKTETPPVTRRPTERLRGGSEPEQEPEERDTRKIAERMFKH